jgi:hypothetical protein
MATIVSGHANAAGLHSHGGVAALLELAALV